MALVLVVDDEESVCEFLAEVLEDAGYSVQTAQDGRRALELVSQSSPDVVLLDIRMPELDGMVVMDRIKQMDDRLPVILMTAFGTTEMAIQAMKAGAFDYIIKPFNLDELVLTVKKAVTMRELAKEVEALREGRVQEPLPMETMIGQSPAMQAVYKNIGRVAASNVTVLIQGESGTGKELVARAIHNNSSRRDGPFVKINCAAIPENLMESELFGHEKGAFTGAGARKPGKFELAHRGTIFLDEIGELSLATQAKLLRVLQEKEFERVGGTEIIRVDVRILAATNKNLEECVQEGTFREDLYFRLKVVTIWVPPLRERMEDVPLLARAFLQKYSREQNKNVTDFSPEAMALLMQYDWPGNVRELKNVCEQAVVMTRGPVILPEDLPPTLHFPQNNFKDDLFKPGMTLKEIVANVERRVILKALQEHNWNRTATARALLNFNTQSQ
ncbi:two-component system, NtrC family, response regulator AtoC [Desulfofundulus australicus DSM 11792]|uniref:DNA-binding transcriptional regulator NtrC n=1 Tax=Desulfofundulus australicus DSM 11792 TaxID=1121425 RepID=A0A1M5DZP3_9FIRM|nr:sigma-54 dependent transcriptional regulator [Desulfofundulus australicus]SHF72467.1 two-component system, NtrC family, response regulator AtoC [Desulfofundulus australicus DSM 11792]